MSFNAESLFNKIQAQEQAAPSGSTSTFNNLILKPKVNCSYSLRLIWLKPFGTCTREYPMINQYIHHYWDDKAVGSKDQVVYCPTSQYIKGDTRDGFDSCPICEKCSELYKQSKEGSSSAKELYKKFRRTLRGYVPVYVVNGPEDVIGKVMILQYGKQFKEFFDRKIFGKMPKVVGENAEQPQPISADEIIGLDAFLYSRNDGTIALEGYNFNVQVTSKRMVIEGRQIDMPQYTMDFSRKPTSVGTFGDEYITADVMDNLNAKIRFDEDFFNVSTTADLTKFKLKYIDVTEAVEEIAEEESVEAAPEIAMNPFKNNVSVMNEEAPVKKVEIESTPVTVSAADDDDIDVDALLEKL